MAVSWSAAAGCALDNNQFDFGEVDRYVVASLTESTWRSAVGCARLMIAKVVSNCLDIPW